MQKFTHQIIYCCIITTVTLSIAAIFPQPYQHHDEYYGSPTLDLEREALIESREGMPVIYGKPEHYSTDNYYYTPPSHYRFR
jgi:hypothetical protein